VPKSPALIFGEILLIVGISLSSAQVSLGESHGGESEQSRVSDPMVEKSSLIVTSDYIIGPEDVLEITVWRNTDLSKAVAVRPDGRISLPLNFAASDRRCGCGW
jgi:Polysaccharide biosynthesis/export protein